MCHIQTRYSVLIFISLVLCSNCILIDLLCEQLSSYVTEFLSDSVFFSPQIEPRRDINCVLFKEKDEKSWIDFRTFTTLNGPFGNQSLCLCIFFFYFSKDQNLPYTIASIAMANTQNNNRMKIIWFSTVPMKFICFKLNEKNNKTINDKRDTTNSDELCKRNGYMVK